MAAQMSNADYRTASTLAAQLGLSPDLYAITTLAGTVAAAREQGREEVRFLVREEVLDSARCRGCGTPYRRFLADLRRMQRQGTLARDPVVCCVSENSPYHGLSAATLMELVGWPEGLEPVRD